MAVVLGSPSPTQLEKDSSVKMESPSLVPSPTPDERFWSDFRSRVDAMVEKRKRKSPHVTVTMKEPEGEDWFREERMLLLKGFESVAASLSLLTQNIDASLQGANNLAKPPLTEIFKAQCANKSEVDSIEKVEEEGENRRKVKRQCGDTSKPADDQGKGSESSCAIVAKNENLQKAHNLAVEEEGENQRKVRRQCEDTSKPADDQGKGSESICAIVAKNENLQKAHNLAVSMAAKAGCLAKEVKSIKMDLCFMQERSLLLEEENRRLREGLSKGLRPEEDDLVRLQLEALLAEKSRLANENTSLRRENQCLQQLVEYHQMTSQHLSDCYEDDDTTTIGGTRLDFSSPCNGEDELGGGPQSRLPAFSILHFPKLDDGSNEDQQ